MNSQEKTSDIITSATLVGLGTRDLIYAAGLLDFPMDKVIKVLPTEGAAPEAFARAIVEAIAGIEESKREVEINKLKSVFNLKQSEPEQKRESDTSSGLPVKLTVTRVTLREDQKFTPVEKNPYQYRSDFSNV